MTTYINNARAVSDRLKGVALSSELTIQMSYRMALAVLEDQIPGDFVECGVFAGANAAAMALAILEGEGTHSKRRVHLFDSFEGIPEPGPNDPEFLAAGHHLGLSKCDRPFVESMMQKWGIPSRLLVYHPGWFELTIAQTIQKDIAAPDDFYDPVDPNPAMVPNPHYIAEIALLRLDGDLYESTRVAIEGLYPRLSTGGICIVDDYALAGCRQAVQEFMGGNFPPVYWRRT